MMTVHKDVGHYGAPITLDQAKKVMAAAEAKATQNNWNVVISIVDSGGHAVMLQRLDGSHLAAIGIAEGKARAAVEFRRPIKALEDAMAGGGVGLKYFTVRGATLIEGSIPIVVDGKIVRSWAASACRVWMRRTMPKLLRLAPTLLSDRCD
jgi:uncharacterized protein GlcG (DUF336 family)